MPDVTDLLDSIERWLDAKRVRREAVASCEHDVGYFCRREIEAEEEAREAVATALDAYVDARVAAVLAERQS